MQVSHPFRGHTGAIKLIDPVSGIDCDASKGDHLHPVLRNELQPGGRAPKHHAFQAAARILHGKVMMAGGIALIVGKLAPNRQLGQQLIPVQHLFDIVVDLAYRKGGHWSVLLKRQPRMAVPMALSVEKAGAAKIPSGIVCRRVVLEATPPENSTGSPG